MHYNPQNIIKTSKHRYKEEKNYILILWTAIHQKGVLLLETKNYLE